MTLSLRSRLAIFSVLALVMAVTRFHHFGTLPDASWAVFFIAGYQLRGSARWAFPALMVIAVAVDYFVITASGMNFWTHYCVSPGYWFLLPAHASLWLGGSLLRRYAPTPSMRALALLVAGLVVSVALCHLFAQGGFYWFSSSVADPSFAGWAKNYADWFLPYLRTAAGYVAIATVVHVALVKWLPTTANAPGNTAR